MDFLEHMRTDPFEGIGRDAEELNMLFGRIPGKYHYHHLTRGCPAADVYETGEKIIVVIELPGVKSREALDVWIEDNVLFIRGHVESGKDGSRYLMRERCPGEYKRSIPLPHEVEEEGAKGRYQNGVLTVEIPKASDSAKKSYRVTIS